MLFSPKQLVSFIVERFELENDEVDETTSLFNDGLLDSFHLLELVHHFEAKLGIKVAPLEMTLENFDTVARTVRYLESKKAS